jgi:futalosine hydrolase
VIPSRVLVASPTVLEMEAFDSIARSFGCPRLICGLGPAATALELVRFIERRGLHTVILIGLAGAYAGSAVGLEDVCLADSEAFGDLGRCGPSGIEPVLIEGEDQPIVFSLQSARTSLLPSGFLEKHGIRCVSMVSVSCATGTYERARELQARFGAAAENMEGAAAAQVCAAYDVPLLEFRGISNWVGEFDRRRWRTAEALEKTRHVLEAVLRVLVL